MAKIDKYLESMISRGAPILRLDPGDMPVLELPGGHRLPLAGTEIMGTVLDGLTREILPESLQTTYLRGEKVTFDYFFNKESFQVLVCKTNLGTRIVVGRGVSSTGVPISAASIPAVATATAAPVKSPKLGSLISRLLSAGGSDLYLNSGELPIMRLDGRLEVLEDAGLLPAKELEDLIKPITPPKNLEVYQTGGDTEFSYEDGSLLCRMRMSLFHDASGPSVSIRVIPKAVPDAATLGLSETLQRLAHLSQGLVLLTGPMGSGKSTTMACLLDIANRFRKDYIVTIQDSTEFEFAKGTCLLRQREVGRDPERQKQAIRSALRQAPDILALGELRETGVIELALQAAHSGRVVFATLQTTSLMDTFYYLIDAFPQNRQSHIRGRLADCLKAVVGHTLLRRASGGRVAAIETLFVNPAIAEHIRADKFEQIPAVMKSGRYGQMSHNDALVQLILSRAVDPMEAYLRCQDRESFIGACKKSGIDFDPRSAGQVTVD
jgi:twitching motility protein PilT